jgi:hypothetical protein
MKAKSKFLNQPFDFWANVKFISQKIGYTERKSSKIKVPTIKEIVSAYLEHDLKSSKIFIRNSETAFGNLLIEYFQYRAKFLTDYVQPNLFDKNKAKKLFNELYDEYAPHCPLPMNKQKGDKKAYAYFTCIINILIEANSTGHECNYDPKELTAFTKENFPIRSLSRRVDGAFPNIINPIAIWEIKQYYYTTTFGSGVADGVYESLLDGYELAEVRRFLHRRISHYLMVDDFYTWWTLGRSYLCRICDMLHMGLLTEALFGKEVVDRIPQLVHNWIKQLEK